MDIKKPKEFKIVKKTNNFISPGVFLQETEVDTIDFHGLLDGLIGHHNSYNLELTNSFQSIIQVMKLIGYDSTDQI